MVTAMEQIRPDELYAKVQHAIPAPTRIEQRDDFTGCRVGRIEVRVAQAVLDLDVDLHPERQAHVEGIGQSRKSP